MGCAFLSRFKRRNCCVPEGPPCSLCILGTEQDTYTIYARHTRAYTAHCVGCPVRADKRYVKKDAKPYIHTCLHIYSNPGERCYNTRHMQCNECIARIIRRSESKRIDRIIKSPPSPVSSLRSSQVPSPSPPIPHLD